MNKGGVSIINQLHVGDIQAMMSDVYPEDNDALCFCSISTLAYSKAQLQCWSIEGRSMLNF